MRKDNIIMYISIFIFVVVGFLAGVYRKEICSNYQYIVVLATFVITLINFQNSRTDRREKSILENNRKREIKKAYDIFLNGSKEVTIENENVLTGIIILKTEVLFITKHSKNFMLIKQFEYMKIILDKLEDLFIKYAENKKDDELQKRIDAEIRGFNIKLDDVKNIKNIY